MERSQRADFASVVATDTEVIIVATEIGIIHRLSNENPDKKFIAASKKAVCPNMKKITLEKCCWLWRIWLLR